MLAKDQSACLRQRLAERNAPGGKAPGIRAALPALLCSWWTIFLLIPSLLTMNGCDNASISCPVPPSITGQPVGQVIFAGQPALFTVAAAGSSPLSYQWMKNGVEIPKANQDSYSTPTSALTDSGTIYTVAVANKFGRLISDPAILTVGAAAPGQIRYVAPNGNDSNAGTIDSPYLTIQRCASLASAGWTCEIRAGTYRETVSPNSGITIEAYNSEIVVVDGTDPIAGWTPYRGSVYQAHVAMSSGDTNQVFVGSQMMTEARWPNGDDLLNVNWAHAQAGTDSGHVVDSKLPATNWAGAKIHLWSGADSFGHETGTVTAYENGKISIDVDQTGTCPTICPASSGLYYLFGTLSALDVEREWFYDSNTSTLYFMAPGKVDPNTLNVRSKQRPYAFDLSGKSEVTIRNITVFASTIVLDSSSANNTLDRINAQYVSHFTDLPAAANDPSGSNFSILQVHESDSGIVLSGTGNILQNSTISFSAGTGVALNGSNNTVRNNLIQNVDYIGDYASGIVLNGNSNTIAYNTVSNAGRQSILFNAVLGQDISYNNIFNSMLLSTDGAAVYACCNQSASATRIHHNWIHDTSSVRSGSASAAMSGVYIDNGSSGFEVDQNVLWNNLHMNVVLNGLSNSGPISNYIHNNSIPSGLSDGNISIQNTSNCTSTRIVDNRVLVDVQLENSPECTLSNNATLAPGATEMTPTTAVGCNFDGCATDPPPAIINGSVTACPVTGTAQPD